jgi:hypothetical protein
MIDRLESDNLRDRASIADRRARQAAGELPIFDAPPQPGPAPYRPDAAAAATTDASGWIEWDRWADARIRRALDEHETALIDGTVAYLTEQLTAMRDEIAALVEQVAALRADSELLRVLQSTTSMIGRKRNAA